MILIHPWNNKSYSIHWLWRYLHITRLKPHTYYVTFLFPIRYFWIRYFKCLIPDLQRQVSCTRSVGTENRQDYFLFIDETFFTFTCHIAFPLCGERHERWSLFRLFCIKSYKSYFRRYFLRHIQGPDQWKILYILWGIYSHLCCSLQVP